MAKWTPILDVLGPVGGGYCHALWVLATNGNEYLAKGPFLVEKFRHVAANELVSS